MSALSQAELLQRVPLFKCLSDAQAQALSLATEKRRFKRNETIIEVGQQSHSLYIILSGNARVILASEKGREIVLASLSSGDCIGEMSLLDDQPHSATVVSDNVLDALVLGHEAFNRCLLQNAALSVAIMQGMVSRLRKANQKIADLALVSVYGRVARCLIEMSTPHEPEKNTFIVKKFSNIKLAKEIGASREMVSKALKDFEKQGFIRRLEDGRFLLIERRAMPRT
jgi:CRP/FNR family transcriptional regulator, cyclic AMP receptor protein